MVCETRVTAVGNAECGRAYLRAKEAVATPVKQAKATALNAKDAKGTKFRKVKQQQKQQQVPFGNDRKKGRSKNNSQYGDLSATHRKERDASVEMTNLWGVEENSRAKLDTLPFPKSGKG